MAKNIKSGLSKCPGCGGNLLFSPQTQDLVCEHCALHVELAKDKNINKHDYVSGKNFDDNDEWAEGSRSYRCKSCGGQVSLVGFEISKICPYCGSTYVSEVKTLPGLKPDAVIPFAFDKTTAKLKFKEQIKHKVFVPTTFKKALPESKIYGLYVPTFSFDADVSATYNGVLEENYTTKDKDGNTIVKTHSFRVSGEMDDKFENVVIESSQKMTQNEIDSILPYDHSRAYNYDEGFVRGFFVEHYEDSLDKCYNLAENVMNINVRKKILFRYRYDRVVYLNVDANYSNKKYAYKLAPVYKFEYSFKKKKYLTCMNGQTGNIQNNLPKSGWKIFGLVFGIVAFIAFIVLMYFVTN